MAGNKIRARRFDLWVAQRGLCWWCKCPTVLPPYEPKRAKGSVKPNEATLDHLYSRLHPLREVKTGDRRYVMACWACNQRRGQEEHTAYPQYKHALKKILSSLKKEAIDTDVPIMTDS